MDLLIGEIARNVDLGLINSYEINITRLKYNEKLNFSIKKDSFKKFKRKGLTENLINIENSKEFLMLYDHFINGQSWKEAKNYLYFINFLKDKKQIFNCNNLTNFLNLLNSLDNLYYKLQRNPDLKIVNDSIKVGITNTGLFIIIQGIFLASIAQILKINVVPIQILIRNRKWLNFRKKILRYQASRFNIYQPLIHPDLKSINTNYSESRFDLIKENMSINSGTLLDIGANLGFFCHKFEDLGFNCYAVEVSSKNAYFMKKLRWIENKRFKIINESIFDYYKKRKKNDFDVVLALNIFHHFIKTHFLHKELIIFLKNLKMKEMFFQAHDPSVKHMKNAYINYKPQQFVKFILKYSCLDNYDMIVEKIDGKNRPLYRLY
ncbi:MAG: methyltransferase domain-containing protein [Promethearchaeota archaeon]